jgi:hypothetical protein
MPAGDLSATPLLEEEEEEEEEPQPLSSAISKLSAAATVRPRSESRRRIELGTLHMPTVGRSITRSGA